MRINKFSPRLIFLAFTASLFWACLQSADEVHYLEVQGNDTLKNYDSLDVFIVATSDTSKRLADVFNGKANDENQDLSGIQFPRYRLDDQVLREPFTVVIKGFDSLQNLQVETLIDYGSGKQTGIRNTAIKAINASPNPVPNPNPNPNPKLAKIEYLDPKPNSKVSYASLTVVGYLDMTNNPLFFRVSRLSSNDSNKWEQVLAAKKGGFSTVVPLIEGANAFLFSVLVDNQSILNDTLKLSYDKAAVDTSAPSITLDTWKNGDTVGISPINLQGKALDAGGISEVKVNGVLAALSEGSWSNSLDLKTGLNTIEIKASDISPRKNTNSLSVNLYYDSTTVDSIVPVVNISSPIAGSLVGSSQILVVGTAVDPSGIASVSINGLEANLSGKIWSRYVPLIPGENTLYVEATDKSKHRNRFIDSVTVTYNSLAFDSLAPTIAITYPSNNTVVSVNSGITIKGNAEDNFGVNSVIVNGVAASLVDNSWQATISLKSLGSNKVTAIAFDNKGNADSAEIQIVYDPTKADTTKPIINVQSIKSGDVFNSPILALKIQATDANGIRTVLVGTDTAKLISGYYLDTLNLIEGLNTIKITAVDNSGNKNTAIQTIQVTYKAPNLVLDSLVIRYKGSPITLSPIFTRKTTVYGTTVANKVDTIAFAFGPSEPGAEALLNSSPTPPLFSWQLVKIQKAMAVTKSSSVTASIEPITTKNSMEPKVIIYDPIFLPRLPANSRILAEGDNVFYIHVGHPSSASVTSYKINVYRQYILTIPIYTKPVLLNP